MKTFFLQPLLPEWNRPAISPSQIGRATALGVRQPESPLSPARPRRPGGRGSLRFAVVIALPLLLPAVVQAQFTFTTSNNALTITGYTGPGGAVEIPGTTNGLPVTAIGDSAFQNETNLTGVMIGPNVTSIGDYAFRLCTSLTSVVTGNGVTNIGNRAFGLCASLTAVYFEGNAPTTVGADVFLDANPLRQLHELHDGH